MDKLPILESGYVHEDYHLRLQCFELITLNPKLTTVPTQLELDMVKKFIALNLRNCSAAFRIKFAVILKKFFIRLRYSSFRAYKHLCTLEQSNDSAKQEKAKIYREQVTRVMNFLHTIILTLQRAFYPGCPHEKLILAVDLYKLAVQIFTAEETEHMHIDSTWKKLQLFPPGVTIHLLNLLNNVWDKVREGIYDLLLLFPSPIPGVSTEAEITSVLETAFKLVKSPRVRESDAGALMIRLLFAQYILRGVKIDKLIITDKSLAEKSGKL